VIESQVNDAVRCRRTGAQAVEVFETAAMDLGAAGRHRCGGSFRARQAKHPMAGSDQLRDHGGPDEPRCSGYEYAHVDSTRH